MRSIAAVVLHAEPTNDSEEEKSKKYFEHIQNVTIVDDCCSHDEDNRPKYIGPGSSGLHVVLEANSSLLVFFEICHFFFSECATWFPHYFN